MLNSFLAEKNSCIFLWKILMKAYIFTISHSCQKFCWNLSWVLRSASRFYRFYGEKYWRRITSREENNPFLLNLPFFRSLETYWQFLYASLTLSSALESCLSKYSLYLSMMSFAFLSDDYFCSRLLVWLLWSQQWDLILTILTSTSVTLLQGKLSFFLFIVAAVLETKA